MSGWLFAAGYVAMALITGRVSYIVGEDSFDRDNGDGMLLLFAMVLWPVTVALSALVGLAFGSVWLVTARPGPKERRRVKERQMKAELDALRKLAREHDLPMPEAAS